VGRVSDGAKTEDTKEKQEFTAFEEDRKIKGSECVGQNSNGKGETAICASKGEQLDSEGVKMNEDERRT